MHVQRHEGKTKVCGLLNYFNLTELQTQRNSFRCVRALQNQVALKVFDGLDMKADGGKH